MLRAIAFDFDGVLAESVDVKTRAYIRLFEKEGEASIQKIINYHMKNGGVSRFVKFRAIYQEILSRPLSEGEFQLLCDRFSQLVVDEVVVAPWVEGAHEFLIRYENQYKFFVISGTPEDELQEIIRRRNMGALFDSVRGSPKDKVMLIREVMTQFNLKPEEMVFVGDAETDWCAAQKIGVPFLWRCASDEATPLSGYIGPRLSSLNELEKNIQKVTSLHYLP